MKMVIPDSHKFQGLHAQTVFRCFYDDSPEPKIHKHYKWVATWPGIKALSARCQCKEPHRRLGTRSPDGAWSGNARLLAESAAYPKRLGKALLDSWMQGSIAISIS